MDETDESAFISIDVIQMMTFGHNTDDGNSTLLSITNINASFFQTEASGVGVKMTAKVGTSSGEGEIRLALYNEARQLIGMTERLTVSTGKTWHDFFFVTQPEITPGGYWMAAWSNDSHMECRMKSLSYKNILATYSVYNGWPSTLAGSPVVSAEMLIYCTIETND